MADMKRAARGLYHGVRVLFGHNVSHSVRRTKRRWSPNVQTKRLWSDIYNDFIKFKVTTKAIRCIDKAGGLDNYLLTTKDSLILYPRALRMKKEMQRRIATGQALSPQALAAKLVEDAKAAAIHGSNEPDAVNASK